jgi:cytochrome c
MNSANRSQSLVSRAVAIAIFGLFCFQLYQSTKVGVTPRGTPAREALQHLHISVGLVILLLVVIRLVFWWREPRPMRPASVPPSADRFARTLCLLGLLTMLAFCLSGPFFAWSEGHAVSLFGVVTLPALLEPSYAAQTRLGYVHSAIGFWVFYWAALSFVTAIYQRARYKAPLLRMLPAFAWTNAALSSAPPADRPTSYSAPATLLQGLVLLGVAGWSSYQPYRVFGVSPFPIAADRSLVTAGPAPVVDLYTGVDLAAPKLSEQGQKDFMWCRFCHSFEAGGPHAVGPNLHRVFGRRAGSAPGFHYSSGFVAAGEGGLVWDDAKVNELIADPEKFLSGNHRMRYKPITDAEERAQIVAALKHATR